MELSSNGSYSLSPMNLKGPTISINKLFNKIAILLLFHKIYNYVTWIFH